LKITPVERLEFSRIGESISLAEIAFYGQKRPEKIIGLDDDWEKGYIRRSREEILLPSPQFMRNRNGRKFAKMAVSSSA